MDDHSSARAVTDALMLPTRTCWGEVTPRRKRRTRSLFGIAPGGACRANLVAKVAVGSYSTVSPLPAAGFGCPTRRLAVCSLWRFPSGCPGRALPGTVTSRSPDFPHEEGFRQIPCSHPAIRAIG